MIQLIVRDFINGYVEACEYFVTLVIVINHCFTVRFNLLFVVSVDDDDDDDDQTYKT